MQNVTQTSSQKEQKNYITLMRRVSPLEVSTTNCVSVTAFKYRPAVIFRAQHHKKNQNFDEENESTKNKNKL